MAPEQAVGEAVDHRADLYAWGVMAYELLTGAHPFAGARRRSSSSRPTSPKMPAPVDERNAAVPPPLAALVMRCLEKDPAQRPASASELLTALDSVSTPGPARGPRVRRGVGARRPRARASDDGSSAPPARRSSSPSPAAAPG